MDVLLTPLEARVIGCLIEKQVSTPEHYPLSLNALTNACNQKNNREPVMALSATEVQQALDSLMKNHLVSENGRYGSRVVKYQHRFFNSEFGGTHFDARQMGLVCELLLRGPQTPGELRTRTARLCKFTDVSETEQVLRELADHAEGPFVVQLPRQPGRRDSRYAQLFCGEVAVDVEPPPQPQARSLAGSDRERIEQLEQTVAQLCQELDELKQRLGED
ncbi:MAG TPA: DUF480 domain-containing protein [Candidatus Tenderia electrophaga]|uniref:DUF480 domain-containing protein n=1 Tax=Candidatus Tenderia electrophaga TaxID=1748243 RepID=A0A832N5N6_9GAMM|nr:DUF480 domain-containing protein [Candidatus Tenderia electrophaga]